MTNEQIEQHKILWDTIEGIVNELTKTQLLELSIYSAKLVSPILKKYIPEESMSDVIVEKAEKVLAEKQFEDFMRMQLAADKLEKIYESKSEGIFSRTPEGARGYIAEGLIEAVYAFTGICDSRVIDGTQLNSVIRATHCIAAGEAIGDLEWTKVNRDMAYGRGLDACKSVVSKIVDKAKEMKDHKMHLLHLSCVVSKIVDKAKEMKDDK